MSMFSPQIGTGPLVGLCRRLSTSLEAGIDARTVWKREAERANGFLKSRLLDISDAVNQGHSLTDALAPTRDYFPTIFREMVAVGEQTGHLDEVFAQLAEHYQAQLNMRRTFLSAIIWPVTELVISLVVIGLAIWIIGLIGDSTGVKTDILGFGLSGSRGLTVYVTFLAVVSISMWLVVRAISRGLVWTRFIQRFVLKIPGVGGPLQILALSRMAWSMHLTMNTSMDVRRAMSLSLRSTQNARYTDQIAAIDADIVAGASIHEAFVRAGGYPTDFLDTLAVGEQTGQIVESMGILAKQYQERARMAMKTLAYAAGFAVWAIIAAIIIVLIFRGAIFYRNTIIDMSRPGQH
jgi:type II secretory pathway component PulF